MAFHVTQCPGCESTFNTSARILQSAAGKVRCGACLMVFEATENFVDATDADDSEDTSVFVGNDPTDYFDPSRFITRSALTDPAIDTETFHFSAHTMPEPTADTAQADDPAIPAHIFVDSNPDALPPAEPVMATASPSAEVMDSDSREFFAAVANELEHDDLAANIAASAETALTATELAKDSIEDSEIEQSAASTPQSAAADFTAQRTEPPPADAFPPPAFTGANTAADESDTANEHEPAILEEVELVTEAQDLESAEADVVVAHSDGDAPEESIFTSAPDQTSEQLDTAADSAPAEQESAAQQETPESTELTPPIPEPPLQAPVRAPEDVRIHASFSIFHHQAIPRQRAEPRPPELPDNEHSAQSSPRDEIEQATTDVPAVDGETMSPATAVAPDLDAEQELAAATPDLEHAPQDADDGMTAEIEVIDLDEFDEWPESHVDDAADATATEPAEATAVAASVPADDEPIVTVDAMADATTDASTVAEKDEDAPPETESAAEAEAETENAVEAESDTTESIRARALRALLRDDEALEALPVTARSAIGKDLPPVELLAGTQRNWARIVLLTLTCILLALTLAAQILWQRLPVYSRMAELRPVYEIACRIASCELPTYSEISAIRSDNLVVRSHPTADDALSVSLNFRNTAAFPQPFPVLILSFNSATNSVIALREFAPEEYLDAGLQNIREMPVMSPVQIELEVMDPGADAVNYTVAFRRP